MVKPRVYVGGLPHDVSERDLEKFFKGFGRLREVLIKNGYGFVEFEDQRDADDAVYELDGEKLLGQRVTVQKARGIPRGRDRDQRDSRGGGGGRSSNNSYRGNGRNDRFGPPTRTKHRVIVENLSSRVSWQDLKDFMRKAGEVTYADAHKEHPNEGVVEFSSYDEMKNAIKKLDDTELNGRRIRIVEDRDGKEGSRSRSRSRSFRSRSNSRSRSRSRKSVSRSKSRSRARKSGSRSPVRKSRSRSPARKSRSRSPVRMSRSRSPARKSRSRSPVRKSRSRDYSRSKSRDLEKSSRRSKSREESKHREMSRSRSRSVRSRSRSRTN